MRPRPKPPALPPAPLPPPVQESGDILPWFPLAFVTIVAASIAFAHMIVVPLSTLKNAVRSPPPCGWVPALACDDVPGRECAWVRRWRCGDSPAWPQVVARGAP